MLRWLWGQPRRWRLWIDPMSAQGVVQALLEEVRVERVPIQRVYAEIEPVDYGLRTWPDIFAYIERNHYQLDPAYWDKFLDSIRKKGIRQPVQVEDWNGRLVMRNGHHRVWAAYKLGLDTIPVRFVLGESLLEDEDEDDFEFNPKEYAFPHVAFLRILKDFGFKYVFTVGQFDRPLDRRDILLDWTPNSRRIWRVYATVHKNVPEPGKGSVELEVIGHYDPDSRFLVSSEAELLHALGELAKRVGKTA